MKEERWEGNRWTVSYELDMRTIQRDVLHYIRFVVEFLNLHKVNRTLEAILIMRNYYGAYKKIGNMPIEREKKFIGKHRKTNRETTWEDDDRIRGH